MIIVKYLTKSFWVMQTVATPKQIRELMKVDGLTNDEVKSHLQVSLSFYWDMQLQAGMKQILSYFQTWHAYHRVKCW